jgi:hypothetical protein
MSNLTDAKPRAAAAVIGGVLAVLVLIIGSFIAFGGRGDDNSTADPGGSTPSTTPSGSAPTSPPAVSSSPVASVPYMKQARRASRDGFPVLVPSDLPPGWAVTGVAYDGGDHPTWHLELTTGQGEVISVEQGEAAIGDMVDEFAPGATEGKAVDLSKWRTRTWRSYGTGGSFALGQELKTTTALIVGTDRTAVISTAKRLLTVETDRPGAGD